MELIFSSLTVKYQLLSTSLKSTSFPPNLSFLLINLIEIDPPTPFLKTGLGGIGKAPNTNPANPQGTARSTKSQIPSWRSRNPLGMARAAQLGSAAPLRDPWTLNPGNPGELGGALSHLWKSFLIPGSAPEQLGAPWAVGKCPWPWWHWVGL